jgi:hypothetical protein
VPDPISWEDEAAIKSAGAALEVRRMRFLDTRGNGVDWEGMREDLMVCRVVLGPRWKSEAGS